MNRGKSYVIDETFRDNDEIYIGFIKAFVCYCKDKELLIDDLIDTLDPENEGKIDKHVFIERAGSLGIKIDLKSVEHFLECLNKSSGKVDINLIFDEVNKGIFIEDSKQLNTTPF